MERLIQFWYDWGVFFGVFIAAAIVIYIYFDSQQAAPGAASTPRLLAIAGLLLTLPSLYNRLALADEIEARLLTDENNFNLFFYLALAGLALGIIALTYYLMRRRRVEPEPVYPTPVYTPVLETPVAFVTPPAPPTMRPTITSGPIGDDLAGQRSRPKTEVISRVPERIAFLIDNETSRQFPLTDNTSIGKNPDNDIPIDEASVSGQHAKIRLENGEFAIFDLASTNGTLVNGNRVNRQVLADGDRVQMGRKTLTYRTINGSSQPAKRNTEAIERAAERIQSMRLDTAVPEEVVVGRSFELAVAVRQIESQQLNVSGLDKVRSEELIVKTPKGASPVQLKVHVQAADCHIIGPSSEIFDLYANYNSPTLYFSLIPLREGEIIVIVKVTQVSFKLLGSARLAVMTRERLTGEIKTSVRSLQMKPPSDDPFSDLLPDLYRFINDHFSLAEVHELSFEMGIDYDALPGGLKSAKIMGLILYCRHRDRHEELIERVIQARPNWHEQL